MTALDMIENLKALDIEAIAEGLLEDNAEVIADLNATQLSQGLRADNSEVLPSYSPLTIEIKKTKAGLSGVTDHVTLFDTGSFYRNLYADVQGEEIEYGSMDDKSEKLQKKYSTQKGSIFGLTEDSKDELVEGHLRAGWEEKISAQTGLAFK